MPTFAMPVPIVAPPARVPRAGITVRVSADGKPAAEANVSIADGSGPVLVTASTDREGIARFEAIATGPYELWATGEALASRTARIQITSVGETTIDLALEAAANVHGQVTIEDAPAGANATGANNAARSATASGGANPNLASTSSGASAARNANTGTTRTGGGGASTAGNAASDLASAAENAAAARVAKVTLIPLGHDHAMRVATLDDNGAFAIAGLPYGRWRVEASVPGAVPTADYVVSVAQPNVAIDIQLTRAGTVAGTVVDPAQALVPNATLVLRDQATGAAQSPFALVPSSIRWVHPLAGERVLPTIDAARFGAVRPGPRPAECGSGHCGIDLGEARGTVVHAAADGVIATLFPEPTTEAGRTVVIHHGGGLKSFYMHLDTIRPGLEVGQPIRAGDPVGTLGSTGFTHSAPHLHFAITYERAGRSWYLDPEPVLRFATVLPEAKLIDEPIVATTSPRELAGASAVSTRFSTDAHGAFIAENVAPGAYVAVAFATDFAPAPSTAFDVRAAEPTTGVIVMLHPGAIVRGRVVGRDGPLPNASLIAGAGMGETAHKVAMTSTDRNGEFILRSLAGKITLTVAAPSYGETARTIVLDDGAADRAHFEDFFLTIENAQLRGQVVAPDGGFAGPVSVRIVEGATRKRGVTNAQGQFLLQVTKGRYVIELSSPDFPTKRVVVDSDRWTELRLEAGGGARAVVRDARDATPLAGVRVEFVGPGGQHASRVTDKSGIAELRGLAPGAWTASARLTGYADAKRELAVRAERGLADVSFDLARGATVAGVVRDRYGRRVGGAHVALGAVSTVADGDGNFRLDGVASGTLDVELEGRRGGLQLRLAPGEDRMSIEVELGD